MDQYYSFCVSIQLPSNCTISNNVRYIKKQIEILKKVPWRNGNALDYDLSDREIAGSSPVEINVCFCHFDLMLYSSIQGMLRREKCDVPKDFVEKNLFFVNFQDFSYPIM